MTWPTAGLCGWAAMRRPCRAMKIYDYGFASRLLRGGDIGIAEAYLCGEWDTPNLTHSSSLFCVNQDWMQTHAGRQAR